MLKSHAGRAADVLCGAADDSSTDEQQGCGGVAPEMAATSAQLSELHRSIAALESAGQHHDAVILRKQALELTASVFGHHSEAFACAAEDYVRRCSQLALRLLNHNETMPSFTLMNAAASLCSSDNAMLEAHPHLRLKLSAVARNNLGLFYHHIRNYDAAAAHLVAAHEAEVSLGAEAERPAATLVNLSAVYVELGRDDRACAVLAEAEQLLGEDERAAYGGSSLGFQRSERSALHVHILTQRGNALERLGDPAKAAAAFGAALRLLGRNGKTRCAAEESRAHELKVRLRRCEERAARVPRLPSGAIAYRDDRSSPRLPSVPDSHAMPGRRGQRPASAKGGSALVRAPPIVLNTPLLDGSAHRPPVHTAESLAKAVGAPHMRSHSRAKALGRQCGANSHAASVAATQRPHSAVATSRATSAATASLFKSSAGGLDRVYGGLSTAHREAFDRLASAIPRSGAAAQSPAPLPPAASRGAHDEVFADAVADGGAAAAMAADTALTVRQPARPPAARRPKTAATPAVREHSAVQRYIAAPPTTTPPSSRPPTARTRRPSADEVTKHTASPLKPHERAPSRSASSTPAHHSPLKSASDATRSPKSPGVKLVATVRLRSPKLRAPASQGEPRKQPDAPIPRLDSAAAADDAREAPRSRGTGLARLAAAERLQQWWRCVAAQQRERRAAPVHAQEQQSSSTIELSAAAATVGPQFSTVHGVSDHQMETLRAALRSEEEARAMARANDIIREQERRIEAQRQELAMVRETRRGEGEASVSRQQHVISRILHVGTKLDALQAHVASHTAQTLESLHAAREAKRQIRFHHTVTVQRFARVVTAAVRVRAACERRREALLCEWAEHRLCVAAALRLQGFFHRTVEVRRATEISARKREAYARRQFHHACVVQQAARRCCSALLARQRATDVVVACVARCQAMWRGRAARALAKHLALERAQRRRVREHNAACAIQNFVVGAFFRRRREAQWATVVSAHFANKRAFAAAKIQATYRMHSAVRRFASQWRAALQARRDAARLEEQQQRYAAEMLRATGRIQHAYRGHLARRQREFRRQTLLRDKISYMEKAMTEHCARVLQRLFRVALARRELRLRREMRQHVQDVREWRRRKDAEEAAAAALGVASARRIQRCGRGFATRRVYRHYRIMKVRELDLLLASSAQSPEEQSLRDTERSAIAASLLKIDTELLRTPRTSLLCTSVSAPPSASCDDADAIAVSVHRSSHCTGPPNEPLQHSVVEVSASTSSWIEGAASTRTQSQSRSRSEGDTISRTVDNASMECRTSQSQLQGSALILFQSAPPSHTAEADDATSGETRAGGEFRRLSFDAFEDSPSALGVDRRPTSASSSDTHPSPLARKSPCSPECRASTAGGDGSGEAQSFTSASYQSAHPIEGCPEHQNNYRSPLEPWAAAARIQSLWRRRASSAALARQHAERLRCAVEDDAARTIAGFMRGVLARRLKCVLTAQREQDAVREDAAIVIQQSVRRMLFRHQNS